MSEKRYRPGTIYKPGLFGISEEPLPVDWEFTHVCNFCGTGEWDIRVFPDGMIIYSCPVCLVHVSTCGLWPDCPGCMNSEGEPDGSL